MSRRPHPAADAGETVELLDGLLLTLAPAPEGVVGRAVASARYASHPGQVHGGIIATLLDESLGRLARETLGHPAVTITLRMRYVAPMAVDVPHALEARILSFDGRIARGSADLKDAAGALVASATATFTPHAQRSAAEAPEAAA